MIVSNSTALIHLDDLQSTGFWLDNRLYQKLLQEAGE
jgi:hypothetical protein